jgi:hypothetical protein
LNIYFSAAKVNDDCNYSKKEYPFHKSGFKEFINRKSQYSRCIEVLLSPVDIIAELIDQRKVDGGLNAIKLKYLILESEI